MSEINKFRAPYIYFVLFSPVFTNVSKVKDIDETKNKFFERWETSLTNSKPSGADSSMSKAQTLSESDGRTQKATSGLAVVADPLAKNFDESSIEKISAVTFIGTSNSYYYSIEDNVEDIAHTVMKAGGVSGSNVEYVLALARQVHKLNPVAIEPQLYPLATLVTELVSKMEKKTVPPAQLDLLEI